MPPPARSAGKVISYTDIDIDIYDIAPALLLTLLVALLRSEAGPSGRVTFRILNVLGCDLPLEPLPVAPVDHPRVHAVVLDGGPVHSHLR